MARDKVTKPGLVVTRRHGESVLVSVPTGESLLVTVDRLEHGGKVRLRFIDTPHQHFSVTRVDGKGAESQ